jgi:hypothetical protein
VSSAPDPANEAPVYSPSLQQGVKAIHLSIADSDAPSVPDYRPANGPHKISIPVVDESLSTPIDHASDEHWDNLILGDAHRESVVHIPVISLDEPEQAEVIGQEQVEEAEVEAIHHEFVAPPEALQDAESISTPFVPELAPLPVALPTFRTAHDLSLIPEDHGMIVFDKHPLSTSKTFQIVLAVAVVGLTAILGWFSVIDKSASKIAEKQSFTQDTLAGVASSFSDEVWLEARPGDNTIVVQPVFRDGKGKSREFLVIPVTKG